MTINKPYIHNITGKLSIYPAIRCIEKHLLQRKLRLIDVFKDVDKKKKWKITAQEFRNALENVIYLFILYN